MGEHPELPTLDTGDRRGGMSIGPPERGPREPSSRIAAEGTVRMWAERRVWLAGY